MDNMKKIVGGAIKKTKAAEKRLESYSNLEPKTGISENYIPSKEDKAIADKAAKLIARDYGETLKKLADS